MGTDVCIQVESKISIFSYRNVIAWIRKVLKMNISAYLRLMRFHKPAGILLLWIPTAWALWIVNHGVPSTLLIIYFFLGTVVMRAAGCVVNDIADRHVDKQVKRTYMRPLTAGEINLSEALWLLSMLLLVAFFIVMQLPIACFYYALVALFITIIYPFCKRFFAAPQLVLGLAFSMGIPMAYAASGVRFNLIMWLLVLLNFAWIVSYDTMYAMADREDDLRIGIKSTAVLFASYDRLIILLLQVFFHGLWLFIAVKLHYSHAFYGYWAAASLVLVYQQHLLRNRDANACLAAFSTNMWYGLLMWCGLMLK